MGKNYTISNDHGDVWYAHMIGYDYIPVLGSFGTKWEAQQYARMYNNLTNKVTEIEAKRRVAYERERATWNET